MSRIDSQQGLTPSLLDRLIDPTSEGTAWRGGYGIEQMIEVVRRDVEDLLNTHRTGAVIPEAFVESRNSVLNYGIPDLISYNAIGPELSRLIGRTLEESISRHEPRLREVRALPLESVDGKSMKVQFQITAKFCVEPSPEVTFKTILQLTTGQASVEAGGE